MLLIPVAFGPKIADFINGTNEATKAEEKFAQGLRDARAEASETGIRLQAYLSISENANVSEERRAEAFKAVKNELSKVIELEDTTDLSGELACAGGACEVK